MPPATTLVYGLILAGLLQQPAPRPAAVPRADVERRIAGHLTKNELGPALQAYDGYVTAIKKPDVPLLQTIARAVLDRSATSPDSAVRRSALRYLAAAGDAQAIDTLRKTAAGAGDAALDARIALVEIGDPGAAAKLGQLLDASPPAVQPQIIKALQDADARAEAPRLLPLVDSPEVPVRTAAMLALGALQYRPAAERLRGLLMGDPIARMIAAIALRRLGDESMDSQVSALLTGILPEVRLMAVEGYGPAGSRRWIPGIKELGTDRNELMRVRAGEALACCDAAGARAILTGALDSAIPSVQAEAARVLAKNGLADARLARRLIGSASDEVRVHGAGAALRLPPPSNR